MMKFEREKFKSSFCSKNKHIPWLQKSNPSPIIPSFNNFETLKFMWMLVCWWHDIHGYSELGWNLGWDSVTNFIHLILARSVLVSSPHVTRTPYHCQNMPKSIYIYRSSKSQIYSKWIWKSSLMMSMTCLYAQHKGGELCWNPIKLT